MLALLKRRKAKRLPGARFRLPDGSLPPMAGGMPYEGLGARHTALATKTCKHGQIISEEGFVGTAFKTEPISRWTNPAGATAQDIPIGEELEVQLGGIHEAPASGNLAAAARGNSIYINSANNTLGLEAQALTGTALNAGWLKVGKVTEVDASRSPAVLRINSEGPVLATMRGTMP